MSTGSPPAAKSSAPSAFDRSHLAATRTLLALVRTGAAIAGGGALVTELLVKGWPRWVVVTLSSGFIVAGYWLMWMALKTGRRLRERFELEQPGQEAFLFPLRQVTFFTRALQILVALVLVLYLTGA